MSIFHLLMDERQAAIERVNASTGDSSVGVAEKWADVLCRIVDYTKSVVWYAKSPFKRAIRIFLETDCSYEKASQLCDMSVVGMYRLIEDAERVLARRFRAVLKSIEDGDVHTLEEEFRLLTDSDDGFSFALHQEYRPVEHDDIAVVDCGHELRFLRDIYNARERHTNIGPNQKKMEHLQYAMSRRDIVASHLWSCIEGNRSISETMELVKHYQHTGQPTICEEE